MYHAHFGLRGEPFGPSPDPRFFFQTEQHREALATLYYAILQRRGFALLLGRAGLGKTSVLLQLLHLLEGKAESAYLPHPCFDRASVLESVLVSLGINSRTSQLQNHRLFYEYLMETRRSGKTCVVMFDEAQALNRNTLEAIRMLSNFETSTEKLVQIILAGQPGLADTLKKPDCEQIRQRLNVVARLKPLNPQEVQDYVAQRLETVGARASLFRRDALDAIVSGSGGVPRNVNTICFNSLSLAYALNHHQVGSPEVTEVMHDLDLASVEIIRPTATIPESTLAFAQVGRSFRSAWIGTLVVLLTAGAFLLRSLSAQARDVSFPTTVSTNIPSVSARAPATASDSVPTAVATNVPTTVNESVPTPASAKVPTTASATAPTHEVRHEFDPPGAFAVQVGVFQSRDNAERVRNEMAFQYGIARLSQGGKNSDRWRVLVGSEATEGGANALSLRIRQGSNAKNAFVVPDNMTVAPRQAALHSR